MSGGAWVSHLVLMEATWVLGTVYSVSSAKLATTVEMLLNHKDLSVEDPEVVTAALEQFRARSTLGFSDCLILETARRAGHLPLGTFDKNLGKVPGGQRL